MSKKIQQKGSTLIELIIVITIVAIVISSGIAMSNAGKPGAMTAQRAIANGFAIQASGLAEASGNGATIVYTPGTGYLALYSGRPNLQGIGSTPVKQSKLILDTTNVTGQNSVNGTKVAIFFDKFGRTTHGSWAPTDGNILIPTCDPTGVPLTINYDKIGALKLNCGGGAFTAYDGNGKLLDGQ